MIAKTINEMNLEELVDTYICNKYGKDPLKCVDCKSNTLCVTGKRIIELINEMTENKKKNNKYWEKGAAVVKQKARNRAVEILKHEDPIKFLVEHEGLKITAAKERIRKYRRAYPDLFDGKVPPYRPRRTDAKRRSEYEEAIKHEDPVKYYEDKYGLSHDTAWHRFKSAEAKFKMEAEEKRVVKEDTNEEEISLDDFLNQHNTLNDSEEEVIVKESIPQTRPSNYEESKMEKKYNELIEGRKTIAEQVEKLLSKLEWYNSAIKSFDAVRAILDNNTDI